MIKDFGANRKAMQSTLYQLSILERVEDDEHIISEKDSNASLKQLILKNIPIATSDYGENAFWVLNLEHAQNIFSAPQGFKTTEEILLFFTCSRLYVVMVELKSTLQPFEHSSGIRAIFKKVKDTMSRFATLLPYFVFDDTYKDLDAIRYVAIIAYNEDNLTPALTSASSFRGEEKDLVEIFKKDKSEMFIHPDFGKQSPVTFKFIQNSNRKESNEMIELDLQELFSDEEGSDYDFSTAIYNEFHCPHQK